MVDHHEIHLYGYLTCDGSQTWATTRRLDHGVGIPDATPPLIHVGLVTYHNFSTTARALPLAPGWREQTLELSAGCLPAQSDC